MSTRKRKADSSTADRGPLPPSARQIELKRQMEQAQQRLNDLTKQLEDEKKRQQEQYDAKKQRFTGLLRQPANHERYDYYLPMRLDQNIQQLGWFAKSTVPQTINMYQALRDVVCRLQAADEKLPFDRFSEEESEALEELKALLGEERMKIDEQVVVRMSGIHSRIMRMLEKTLEEQWPSHLAAHPAEQKS